MSTDGSVMSWIKIMPKYKINREGEPVKSNIEVLLKVSERSSEFLHCADRPPSKGKSREVNSSLEEPTPWRINVFQKVDEFQNPALLLAGELVYIRDPELQCMLAPLTRPMEISIPQAPQSTRLNSPEAHFFESPWTSEKFNILNAASPGSSMDLGRSSPKSREDNSDSHDEDIPDDVSVSSVDEFVTDYGEVVLKPMEEDTLDTDAIWMLENKSITKGGSVAFKTDRVHLRHFNTGKYLSMKPRGEDDSQGYLLTLESDPSDNDLFAIIQLHSASEFLNNAKAMQLKHDKYNMFIERGTYQDSQRVYTCLTNKAKSKGVNIIINRYTQKEKFSVVKAAGKTVDEIQDIYFGKA
eukprot:gene30317-37510_t